MMESYRAIPAGAPVRLAKPTSNLFRNRTKTAVRGLDTSGLRDVIAVDPMARTADVAGMCTYETLVAATLPHGLSPLVVPQLKTITVGGAVTVGVMVADPIWPSPSFTMYLIGVAAPVKPAVHAGDIVGVFAARHGVNVTMPVVLSTV